MAATLIPPPLVPEEEVSPSDDGGKWIGGVPCDPEFPPHENITPDQSPASSSWRLFVSIAMVWIVALFGTLTCALEWRWGHSHDWAAIPLPSILYANTAILLLSSLSLEFARRSQRSSDRHRTFLWLCATVVLAAGFICGQIAAWRELSLRGFGIALNPGSCFFYIITGAHLVLLLPGIAALLTAVVFFDRSARRGSAFDVAALYWNFMDALWVCLLALLFLAIQ